MIYLDNAATTLRKPAGVSEAVRYAIENLANPGRGGHASSMKAGDAVYQTRRLAAKLFECSPDQVCFTLNATHALNIALFSLLSRSDRVVISGLEHNAVTRTLHAIGAKVEVVRAPLFSAEQWLEEFRRALAEPAKAVVCTHVSNVFGCVLPVEALAALCRQKNVPLVVDASQSAGVLPVSLKQWGAAFVAMPGHKGLLGPQGTGLLLCGRTPKPLLFGGTGSLSQSPSMPEETPERIEAGTVNVPGICGLGAALRYLLGSRADRRLLHERQLISACAQGLRSMGATVYAGAGQSGVLSFTDVHQDPEELCARYAARGIALRAGLHCAPLAHETAGTLPAGTIRVSVSPLTQKTGIEQFLSVSRELIRKKKV